MLLVEIHQEANMEDNKVKVVAETAGGKEIGYRKVPFSTLYEIAFTSGGEVPSELQGKYSLLRNLIADITSWLVKAENVRTEAKKATSRAKKA